ncbi:MAG: M3 family metallopeptidase [Puniceicoccales bacterium]|jgi:oligopeptidase A|nr:M3 family metallopeptidase [Puniceicoccales bacterium]
MTPPQYSPTTAAAGGDASAASAPIGAPASASAAHPFLSQEFLVRWETLGAEGIEPDISLALERAGDALEKLAAQPRETMTFESVVLGFEDATRELELAWQKVEHLNSVVQTPRFRECYNRILPRVSAFSAAITLNPRVWALLRDFSATPAAAALTGAERRLLDETLAEFTDSGANLPDDAKRRLEELDSELARLTQKFSENVLDATNAWKRVVTDPRLLDGLPESALKAAEREWRNQTVVSDQWSVVSGEQVDCEAAPVAPAPEKPQTTDHWPLTTDHSPQKAWLFTLHGPSIMPVLQYATNEQFRRECWEAWVSVGAKEPWDNTALVRQILALRDEKARLLGRQNFADLVTARRMAKSGAGALRFVEDMARRVRAHFERETCELREFAEQQDGVPRPAFKPWETAFLAERQLRVRDAFDSEALRPYLPIGGVIDGMFDIFGELFGVRVVQRATTRAGKVFPATARARSDAPPVEVWHDEVRFYEVYDATTGDAAAAGAQSPRHLGSFYTDWHPRAEKRGGAWMNFIYTGRTLPDGSRTPHLGLICGNFSTPTGGEDPRLTHDEALTIFHEFGHLLHHILSEAPYDSLGGTRVAWDFVELPSQLLENWCWQKDALDRFARHYKTGEPLPADLLEKLVRASRYRAASAAMRQLSLAKLDLELHLNYARWKDADPDTFWNETLRDYHMPLSAPTPTMARRFTHIFGDPTGYAAGYYSYKWAEVLEADVFTRFLTGGIHNTALGRELRAKIYAKGNTAPPEELFRDFMGREPDPNALLAREGLA